MKKQQREKEQQEKLALKEKEKVLRQQELESSALAVAVVTANPSAEDSSSKVAALAMSETEQAATAAAAAADGAAAAAALAARQASTVSSAKSSRDVAKEKLDEASVKKLFQLLDRSEKNSVTKKDVLIALRKHAPVRVLFGLPAGSAGTGGVDLQARINAIQDSFEASSGLGELSAVFEELVNAGEGAGQTFAWGAFLAYCQQEARRPRAAEALSLLPREHSVGAVFEATYEWRLVPEGASCAAGLEFKMDLGGTGRTMARLPRPNGWK